MPKPELRDHRKFLKLCRLLKAPVPHVIGYLDCLWNRGYQVGNPFIGDADDIEAAALFPGEPGTFAEAAFKAGFLDEVGGGYAIHDLYEHAPAYAKKRIERAGFRPETGQMSQKRGSDGTFVPSTVPNVTVTVPPNQTKPNQTKKNIPATFVAEANSKNAICGGGGSKNDPEPVGTRDNATCANPEAKNVKISPERDAILTAIEYVTGLNRISAASALGKVSKNLMSLTPPADPSEILQFGQRFFELCPWAVEQKRNRPTPTELQKYFTLVRATPIPIPEKKSGGKYLDAVDRLDGIFNNSGKSSNATAPAGVTSDTEGG